MKGPARFAVLLLASFFAIGVWTHFQESQRNRKLIDSIITHEIVFLTKDSTDVTRWDSSVYPDEHMRIIPSDVKYSKDSTSWIIDKMIQVNAHILVDSFYTYSYPGVTVFKCVRFHQKDFKEGFKRIDSAQMVSHSTFDGHVNLTLLLTLDSRRDSLESILHE